MTIDELDKKLASNFLAVEGNQAAALIVRAAEVRGTSVPKSASERLAALKR